MPRVDILINSHGSRKKNLKKCNYIFLLLKTESTRNAIKSSKLICSVCEFSRNRTQKYYAHITFFYAFEIQIVQVLSVMAKMVETMHIDYLSIVDNLLMSDETHFHFRNTNKYTYKYGHYLTKINFSLFLAFGPQNGT